MSSSGSHGGSAVHVLEAQGQKRGHRRQLGGHRDSQHGTEAVEVASWRFRGQTRLSALRCPRRRGMAAVEAIKRSREHGVRSASTTGQTRSSRRRRQPWRMAGVAYPRGEARRMTKKTAGSVEEILMMAGVGSGTRAPLGDDVGTRWPLGRACCGGAHRAAERDGGLGRKYLGPGHRGDKAAARCGRTWAGGDRTVTGDAGGQLSVVGAW
jgi:hypothetical protein